MSQGSQKNYLFVSNHCQHSKKLLQKLQNTAIINDIQIVNIDDKRVQLPSFVQCVPTLYIQSKRQVMTDRGTDNAYEQMMKSRGAEMQQRGPPQSLNFSSP